MKRLFTTLSQKWPEYLLEILVLIIGIYGAFELENWNESRKASHQEQLVLSGLREEFIQNLKELESDHLYNTISLNATKAILHANGQSIPGYKVDSLLGHAINFATFDPRRGVIDEVISSGKLSLIQAENLRYKLTQWSGELGSIQEDIVMRREQFFNGLVPACNQHISLRNTDHTQKREDFYRADKLEAISYPQENYDRMLSATTFDGELHMYYINQFFVYQNEEKLRSFMNEVLALIDENVRRK
jgi:hypothetical protein